MTKSLLTTRVSGHALALALLAMSAGLACWTGHKPPPSTPIQAVELTPEERLGIDDVFEVRVFGEQDLSDFYRVAADGTIDFPSVGRISGVGLRSGEVQEIITNKLKDGY